MNIRLLTIGKTKEKWIQSGMDHYTKRLKPFVRFDIKYLKDPKSSDIESKKKSDGLIILDEIEPTDYLILLDEGGQEMNSVDFAKFIDHPALRSRKNIIFVIGGAYGFSEEVYHRADEKLALSLMTFPHDLIRVMFMEQLYRAFTILNNKNYHHS